MKVDLATVVLGWDKALGSTDHVLSKGVEFAKENGIAESDLLDLRLAPDMFPLARQVQIVCNLVNNWAARAAGVPIPDEPSGETVDALKEDIATTRRFLASLKPEQFEGRDCEVVTVELGTIAPTMQIAQWVLGFATTNIFFHLSIAYAILRSRGVPLGKADLFGGGL
jgi:hypothetical protein